MFGNLLNIAASVIPQQEVQWVRFESRVQNARGEWVNTYADPVPVIGSFQAMDARTVKEMGFDVSRAYRVLYTSHDMHQVQRGTSPDRILYSGDTYDIVGEPGDWMDEDGWKSVHCVRVNLGPRS